MSISLSPSLSPKAWLAFLVHWHFDAAVSFIAPLPLRWYSHADKSPPSLSLTFTSSSLSDQSEEEEGKKKKCCVLYFCNSVLLSKLLFYRRPLPNFFFFFLLLLHLCHNIDKITEKAKEGARKERQKETEKKASKGFYPLPPPLDRELKNSPSAKRRYWRRKEENSPILAFSLPCLSSLLFCFSVMSSKAQEAKKDETDSIGRRKRRIENGAPAGGRGEGGLQNAGWAVPLLLSFYGSWKSSSDQDLPPLILLPTAYVYSIEKAVWPFRWSYFRQKARG